MGMRFVFVQVRGGAYDGTIGVEHPLPGACATTDGFFINVRKLAALDIVFHGSRFVVAEFAVGVVACGAGGLFILTRSLAADSPPALFPLVLGGILLFSGINYVPLLLYALVIVQHDSARDDVAPELRQKERYARKYGVQQVLLLVPLSMPILALYQEWQKRSHPTG